MNSVEQFLCASKFWRYLSERALLPWALSGLCLGDHLLELGAGYGAATRFLRERVSRVTSLEYDGRATRRLKSRHCSTGGAVLQGDAAQLPFAAQSFSSVIAVLVLHHLRSQELQDRMFGEVFRVLRPRGVFAALEVHDSWFHRLGHFRSTFLPLDPTSASVRLRAAGFSQSTVEFRTGGFRITAERAIEAAARFGETATCAVP